MEYSEMLINRIKAVSYTHLDVYKRKDNNCTVSDTALMCFRAQIFTTRSHVAIVEGLRQGHPRISGIFDSQGREIPVNWE